jgi:oligoendopeptidase F
MNQSKYELSAWSLGDLFPSQVSPEMDAAIEELESKVEAFEARRESLTDKISKTGLIEIIQELEAVTNLSYRIHSFASLQFAADTQDQEVQAFLSRVDQLMAEMQNRVLFFSLWWKGLDPEKANILIAGTGDFRYWLEEMRHFRPFTLSETEEKIINLKDVTGSSALTKLYDMITNRYVYSLEVEGEQKQMTRGQIMVYARDPDPDLRAGAYQEIYRIFGEDGAILGQIYQALVRDWFNEQVKMRGYTTPISARNLVNDVPDSVVDTLLEVSERNTDLFQRFFKLKSGLIGVDQLSRYDIYAPVEKSEKTYSFNQGIEMVMDSFADFDSRFVKMAGRIFENQRLDSEVRKGKRDGAFCATVTPDLTPWVLVNYQGRAEDVATISHEFGHAIHSMLAEQHSVFTQHASLPLAETASTFAEMLLVDYMLANENNERVRRDILFRQVDDAYATIMRQVFFALFERRAHDMVAQNASVEELSAAYMENLEEQFGDAVALSDEFRWEWVSIPHIYHVPFYVYAYAFGQLLVLSLYQQYKTVGLEAFKPRYLEILAAGGSASPEAILKRAQVDIHSHDFWQGGYDVLRSMVSELEKL